MNSQYTITSNGLDLLRRSLGLLPELSRFEMLDALFVSIDFENPSTLTPKGSTQPFHGQIGVAIFDTRDINESLSSTLPMENSISTYNFAIGPSYYCASASRRFLFGKTTTITQQEIIHQLDPLIPRTRKIIFVGYDFRHDLRALRHLDFDMQTSVLGILDTSRIIHEVNPASSSSSLRDILTELHCPFDKLHSAGNDANFTLRALLLLAAQSCCADGVVVYEKDQRVVELISGIAQSNIPLKRDPNEKASRKRRKRFEKSRKHQSKSWDLETQERIRAERTARRIQKDHNLQYESHIMLLCYG